MAVGVPFGLPLYMLTLNLSPSTNARFLESQRQLPLTYREVGATAGQLPQGYVVDRTRALLGQGEAVFLAAQAGLRAWRHFDLGWLEAWPAETPLAPDEVIAVIATAPGIAWLNACRIVYTIDEDGPVRRFGFAYGTLPSHAECGEERFIIEWNRAMDEVWYDVLAFSRPRHWLARLGYPLVRHLQKRFARDSVLALRRSL